MKKTKSILILAAPLAASTGTCMGAPITAPAPAAAGPKTPTDWHNAISAPTPAMSEAAARLRTTVLLHRAQAVKTCEVAA